MAVVRQFEQMDVYTPTTAAGIANSRDKLRSIQILSRHDVGIPATTFVRDRADVLPRSSGSAVHPSSSSCWRAPRASG
jgi:ribosomal protein S6--L-glutamate ligase